MNSTCAWGSLQGTGIQWKGDWRSCPHKACRLVGRAQTDKHLQFSVLVPALNNQRIRSQEHGDSNDWELALEYQNVACQSWEASWFWSPNPILQTRKWEVARFAQGHPAWKERSWDSNLGLAFPEPAPHLFWYLQLGIHMQVQCEHIVCSSEHMVAAQKAIYFPAPMQWLQF